MFGKIFAVKCVNTLLEYLNPDEGPVGMRLAGNSTDPAVPRDFIYVKKVREIVDSLTAEEQEMLEAEGLDCLEWAENLAEE